jgi:hypothetical protein
MTKKRPDRDAIAIGGGDTLEGGGEQGPGGGCRPGRSPGVPCRLRARPDVAHHGLGEEEVVGDVDQPMGTALIQIVLIVTWFLGGAPSGGLYMVAGSVACLVGVIGMCAPLPASARSRSSSSPSQHEAKHHRGGTPAETAVAGRP